MQAVVQVDRLLDPVLSELLEYVPPPTVVARGRTAPTAARNAELSDPDRIHYLFNRITALVR